jgi:hypothetical protein
MPAQNASARLHVQAQNFAGLAFGRDLEWPTADLAICREPLKSFRGVHHNVDALAAVRALNWFGDFHG